MTSKLKIALFMLLLFAGLFLFAMAEAPAQMLRWGRPLAVVGIFGYLIYAAVVLLRSSSKAAGTHSTDDQCGVGCGCNSRSNQPKSTQKKGNR